MDQHMEISMHRQTASEAKKLDKFYTAICEACGVPDTLETQDGQEQCVDVIRNLKKQMAALEQELVMFGAPYSELDYVKRKALE